jgi:F-type H+-transporting ATPase subunit b
MELDNSFWAMIALFVFIGGLIYMKIPQNIIGGLDSKIDKIQAELDEAKKLREEAQALLAKYERKRKEAENEAQEIIEAAKEEANRLSEEAKISMQELIARRTKAVEEKIAQAEAQAINEVRARSADVAIEAARNLLTTQMSTKGNDLIASAIKEVGTKLN